MNTHPAASNPTAPPIFFGNYNMKGSLSCEPPPPNQGKAPEYGAPQPPPEDDCDEGRPGPPPPRRVNHTYRDLSRYEPTTIYKGKKASSNFPAKLHRILSTPEYSHIITWMPHGRSWKILNKDLLVSEVIPNYFVQTKYESFTRQLSGWGFKRLHQSGPDFRAYYHECFLRGLPQLTHLMKRVPANLGKLLPHVEGEPNFYDICKRYPLPDETVPAPFGVGPPPPYSSHGSPYEAPTKPPPPAALHWDGAASGPPPPAPSHNPHYQGYAPSYLPSSYGPPSHPPPPQGYGSSYNSPPPPYPSQRSNAEPYSPPYDPYAPQSSYASYPPPPQGYGSTYHGPPPPYPSQPSHTETYRPPAPPEYPSPEHSDPYYSYPEGNHEEKQNLHPMPYNNYSAPEAAVS